MTLKHYCYVLCHSIVPYAVSGTSSNDQMQLFCFASIARRIARYAVLSAGEVEKIRYTITTTGGLHVGDLLYIVTTLN